MVPMNSVVIQAIRFEKAFFQPGEPASWKVNVSSKADLKATAQLVARISHLDKTIIEIEEEVVLDGGQLSVNFTWQPPVEAPRGYGLDVYLVDHDGQIVTQASAGFDVLERWTQMPRYGFLTDFQPGRQDAKSVMEILTGYHINALQFYDWMYRHEQFLTNDEPYIDLLGRELSRQTVDGLITAAHERGIAAMPYTAIYGASIDFYNHHPDWVLYHSDGKPALFGDNFMVIMDPRPESPWMQHLLDQFRDVLNQTQFDGIHLDQYGDPKVGYDAKRISFDLAGALAESIDATRKVVDELRPGGAVAFNAVTNWPVEQVAVAGEDIVYIEVWPPYTSFGDLHTLIVSAQKISDGKPVVLAAYVHPWQSANPQINDAIIFASGGGHIELGEENGYLADPYFPKYEVMDNDQAETLRRYYDFAVRYQNWIGPQSQDVTRMWADNLKIPGVDTSNTLQFDKVFPIVRENGDTTSISLVNLLGLPHGKWNEPVPAPQEQSAFDLLVTIGDRKVASVSFASPDRAILSTSSLEFTQKNDRVTIKVPELKIWDLIIIRWEK